jgi:hypothetical protein
MADLFDVPHHEACAAGRSKGHVPPWMGKLLEHCISGRRGSLPLPWLWIMARMLMRAQVKPLSCVAHHRDRGNPKDIGVNDAMGEFSLTAIDSLSTLAAMAGSSEVEEERFWEVVKELGRIYWWLHFLSLGFCDEKILTVEL